MLIMPVRASQRQSLIAVSFKNGILIVAENPSNTLHKVSEIYDRIAFAAWANTTNSINYELLGSDMPT